MATAAAAVCALYVFRTVCWCSILVQVILRATAIIYLCTFLALSFSLPLHFPRNRIRDPRVSQDNIWRFISNYYFSCDFFVVVAIFMRWFFVFISSFEHKKTQTKCIIRINWAENNTIWMAQNTWMAPKKLRENKLNLNISEWNMINLCSLYIYFRQIKMYKLQSQRIAMVSFVSFRASFGWPRERDNFTRRHQSTTIKMKWNLKRLFTRLFRFSFSSSFCKQHIISDGYTKYRQKKTNGKRPRERKSSSWNPKCVILSQLYQIFTAEWILARANMFDSKCTRIF